MNLRTGFAYDPEDTREVRLEKLAILLVAGSCSVAGLAWTAMYWLVFGWGLTAALPLTFVVVVGGSLVVAHITRNHRVAIHAQIVCIVYVTALIQWSMGGLFNAGVVLVWGFLGPLCALMFLSEWHALTWLGLYLLNILVTVLFNGFFAARGATVSASTKSFFLLMNLSAASLVVFLFARYYVKTAIRQQKKANQLLDANLQQEIALRESRKLATLGKLSAGVAHELNNPASAIQSGAGHLRDAIHALDQACLSVARLNLSCSQLDRLASLTHETRERAVPPGDLDLLARSDREADVERWLDENGVENAWELASGLVGIEYGTEELASLREEFSDASLPAVLKLVYHVQAAWRMVEEIGEGAGRVASIVKSLKTYTFMDRASLQAVNVHEGLDDTLVMLRGKLKDGVSVRREYATDLPLVEGYGSELNQVWTNLIDNAVDAMKGEGRLTLRTYIRDSRVVVEIEDDGPGIPLEIQESVFDPFFTTKEPGRGTGLGLNISHNIVTQQHKGRITLLSRPGRTCFQVELPLAGPVAVERPRQEA